MSEENVSHPGGVSESDTELKRRLLSSALTLFAEHGRDGVSLRQIADHAGVSHGSVRYHFGSKDQLYLASLFELVEGTEMAPDCPDGPLPEAPNREQAEIHFRHFVRSFVSFKARAGSNTAVAMGFLRAEMTRDGGPDPVFYERIIAPGHEHLKRIIHGLNARIVDDKLEMVAFNVIAQCIMVRSGQGIYLKRLRVNELSEDVVEEIADTIINTTLHGIDAH